jgi:hypothetical protein
LGNVGGDNSGGGGGGGVGGGRRHVPRGENRSAGGGCDRDDVLGGGAMGDGSDLTTSAPAEPSSRLHHPPPSSDSSAKRRKISSSFAKSHPVVDVSSSPSALGESERRRGEGESLSIEVGRLRDQVIDLRGRLDEANARNDAIRNNQTLMGAELQRRLKRREAELEEVRRAHELRISAAHGAIERLVREGSEREGRELRQKLASDGARLGRLTTTRVGGVATGMIRSHHATSIETWEDGHAPIAIRTRRNELRTRRECLERQWGEMTREIGGITAATSSAESRSSSSTVTSVRTRVDSLTGGDESTNADETRSAAMTDLDRMEAMETLRMHLEEMRKKEMELDGEERALNVEKRAHVRALKLVSNEDSSKYKAHRKVSDGCWAEMDDFFFLARNPNRLRTLLHLSLHPPH